MIAVAYPLLFAWSVYTQVKGYNESYGIYNARDDGGIRDDNYVERPPMLGQPFNGLYILLIKAYMQSSS